MFEVCELEFGTYFFTTENTSESTHSNFSEQFENIINQLHLENNLF